MVESWGSGLSYYNWRTKMGNQVQHETDTGLYIYIYIYVCVGLHRDLRDLTNLRLCGHVLNSKQSSCVRVALDRC